MGTRLYPDLARSTPYPGNFLATTTTPNSLSGYWTDQYASHDGYHTNLPVSNTYGRSGINLTNQYARTNAYTLPPLGINLTSQSTTCMGHNQIEAGMIPYNEQSFLFVNAVRGGPSYLSFTEKLADRPVDLYKTIPVTGYHSLGRSGSETAGLFKMLIAGGNIPNDVKALLKQHGHYAEALLYIFKAALPFSAADGSPEPYQSELRHRTSYLSTGHAFSNEFAPYNVEAHQYHDALHLSNMIQIARSMTSPLPIALIRFIDGTREKGGVVTPFSSVPTSGFTTISAQLGAGEKVTLRIDVGRSADLLNRALTYRWTPLYPEQKNVRIIHEGGTIYRIEATHDPRLPKGRLPVLFTVSNGVFWSNPAVVSFYPMSTSASCSSYPNGSNPDQVENVNLRPVLTSSAGTELFARPGERVSTTINCVDPEGFPTTLHRWTNEVGALNGSEFSWTVPADYPGKIEDVRIICTDGTGSKSAIRLSVIVERADQTLPAPWHAADRNAPFINVLNGRSTLSGSVAEISADGSPDLAGNHSSSKHVLFYSSSGDTDVAVRMLASTAVLGGTETMTGLTLSENLGEQTPRAISVYFRGGNSRYVTAVPYSADAWTLGSKNTPTGAGLPTYLRLVRLNNSTAAYHSSDGLLWKELVWGTEQRGTHHKIMLFLQPRGNSGRASAQYELLPSSTVKLPILKLTGTSHSTETSTTRVYTMQASGASVKVTAIAPAGTQLFYTLDGGNPTRTSTPYTAPIEVNPVGSYTVKVRAFTDSGQSDVASMSFEIKAP